MERGIVSMRVASVLRSAEIKPLVLVICFVDSSTPPPPPPPLLRRAGLFLKSLAPLLSRDDLLSSKKSLSGLIFFCRRTSLACFSSRDYLDFASL